MRVKPALTKRLVSRKIFVPGRQNRQAKLKSPRGSSPVFLSFELRVDAFEKSAEFLDIPFRNQFDSPVIFDNLHFLPWAKMQCLPDGFWYNDLILG